MPDDCLVIFSPAGRRGRFAAGKTVRDAALALGVDLDSVCGGVGLCGRCQIDVDSSQAQRLSPWNEVEERYHTRRPMRPGRRLACQVVIEGDVTVSVPPEFQVHRPVVRKESLYRDITRDCDVRACFVTMPATKPHDADRLVRALQDKWGLGELTVDAAALIRLSPALDEGDGSLTAIVRKEREIIDVRPGFAPEIYGVAADIGSTTLALQVVDMTSGDVVASLGGVNPQIRFGDDIMSRLSYLLAHKDGSAQLTSAVRQAVNDLILQATRHANIDPRLICEAVVVGNPVMHHLFFGLDAAGLATAPFSLATEGPVVRRADDLGLPMLPAAEIYAPPAFGAHVGADAAAAVLAEAPHRGGAVRLLIDVGTNAEIVLSDGRRVLAASSPTGPAFEGAQISSGQRAAPGAIERVRIDPLTLEPRFKVIGCDVWSDDSGFNTAVTSICGSGIVEALVEMARGGILRADGSILGEAAQRTWRVVADGPVWAYILHREGERDIRITQQDVRAIQLAKAALQAGARLLMDRLGCAAVDEIYLAGGFGSQIDPSYALALGMLPPCRVENVHGVGNAAGVGARIALLNQRSRVELTQLAARVEKIETALEPDFQHHFVNAMTIPAAIIATIGQGRTRRRGRNAPRGRT